MLARDRLDGAVAWWCYEDSGYKHIPGMLAWRVSSLFRGGVWPTPVCPPTDVHETRKQTAIACYPTQLRALGGRLGDRRQARRTGARAVLAPRPRRPPVGSASPTDVSARV